MRETCDSHREVGCSMTYIFGYFGCEALGMRGHSSNTANILKYTKLRSLKAIQKPRDGEFPAYAHTYIDLLPDDGRILHHLEDNLASTKKFISSIRPTRLLRLTESCAPAGASNTSDLADACASSGVLLRRQRPLRNLSRTPDASSLLASGTPQ